MPRDQSVGSNLKTYGYLVAIESPYMIPAESIKKIICMGQEESYSTEVECMGEIDVYNENGEKIE